MNELDLVLSWLANVAAGADCGICNAINNGFDNLLNLGIGVAGAAGAAAGTVVGGASRVGDAARDARDAFDDAYDRASGGDSAPPDNSDWFSDRLRDAADRSTPAPSSTVSAGPPEIQGPPRHPFSRDPEPQPPGAIPHGTLQYFGVGGPTGPGMESQQ